MKSWSDCCLRNGRKESIRNRITQIICDINWNFMQFIQNRFQNDSDLLEIMANTSIFSNDVDKRVRMANLCLVGSHKVNGVSELHTSILRDSIFRYFDRIRPDQIINITNGITPRRWLLQCNPGSPYSSLLYSRNRPDYHRIGWVHDMDNESLGSIGARRLCGRRVDSESMGGSACAEQASLSGVYRANAGHFDSRALSV